MGLDLVEVTKLLFIVADFLLNRRGINFMLIFSCIITANLGYAHPLTDYLTYAVVQQLFQICFL